MQRRSAIVAGMLLVAAGAAGACASFDSVPDSPDGATDAGTSSDALDGTTTGDGSPPSGDAGGDALDAGPPCTPPYPTNGLLMLVAEDAGACPSDSTSLTLKAAPVAQPSACSCGACTPVTNPSCGSGGKVVGYGDTNACSEGTQSFFLQDSTCFSASGTFDISPFNRWPTQTPSAGSCSATKVTDPSKVTATTLRACAPSTPAGVCSAIASGERLCVPRNVDGGSCAAPFTVELDAGDDVMLSCSACSCSRTSAKCVVEYHGNAACTALKSMLDLDGACVATGAPQDVTHFKMRPSTPSCVATPGAPSVSLTNARALCCTP